MTRGLVVLLLGGCHEVFGLGELGSVPTDAPVVLAMHDEDGDGADDAIDSCPNVANADDSDTDNDGVGDACDPHPDEPDRLHYFDSFQTLSPRWSEINGGEWLLQNDAVTQLTTTGQFYLLLDQGDRALAFPSILLKVEAFSVSAGGALGTTITPPVPAGIGCVVDYGFGGQLSYYERRADQPNVNLANSMQLPLTFPVDLRADGVRITTNDPGCRATTSDGTPAAVGNQDVAAPVAAARVALVTTFSTATFSSIAVYELAE